MGLLSNYWQILRLAPCSGGYEQKDLATASQFLQGEWGQLSTHTALSAERDQIIQRWLLAIFQRQGETTELFVLAKAGLCLRCYVSHGLVGACRRLASVFSAAQAFAYSDLLPFVLDDDGMGGIILDAHDTTQWHLHRDGEVTPLTYARFTVEVLRRFDPDAQGHFNLNSWVHYQTRQHPDIKRFLSERGFSYLTDWALLNQVSKHQQAHFSDRDRALIQAFHQVYRRDRRRHSPAQRRKCPDPSPAQLQEMADWLGTHHHLMLAPDQVPQNLKRIAKTLRQLDIWQRRGMPVWDALDRDTAVGDAPLHQVVDPKADNTLEAIAWQDLQSHWQGQIAQYLERGIIAGLNAYIAQLHQRPRYRALSPKVIPALHLIYRDGKSQREVADLLALTNQSQVSRLLDLKTLLNHVRDRTVAELLTLLQPKLDAQRCARDPDYIATVVQQIEQFVETEVLTPGDASRQPSARQTIAALYHQYWQPYLEERHESYL